MARARCARRRSRSRCWCCRRSCRTSATACGRRSGTSGAVIDEPLAGAGSARRWRRRLVELIVQVNGKLRGRVQVPAGRATRPRPGRGLAIRRCSASSPAGGAQGDPRARQAGESGGMMQRMAATACCCLARCAAGRLRLSSAGAVALPASLAVVRIEAIDPQSDFYFGLRKALLAAGTRIDEEGDARRCGRAAHHRGHRLRRCCRSRPTTCRPNTSSPTRCALGQHGAKELMPAEKHRAGRATTASVKAHAGQAARARYAGRSAGH